MADYVVSFFPLSCTAEGRSAVRLHGLYEFIDGSCRHEPDFERNNPAITGLCRPGFSKRLEKGSRVIYWTNTRGLGENYIVAVLRVIEKISNHKVAAEWYSEKANMIIPQNLIIEGNEPFPFDHTHRIIPFEPLETDAATIRKWDIGYHFRARKFQDVAICEFLEGPFLGAPAMESPLLISPAEKLAIFGKIPNTHNAYRLGAGEWERFAERFSFFPRYGRRE